MRDEAIKIIKKALKEKPIKKCSYKLRCPFCGKDLTNPLRCKHCGWKNPF